MPGGSRAETGAKTVQPPELQINQRVTDVFDV